jgi:CarboxypepD_reg-like domain/TonB-dependent Receptor Plug Domain
LKRIVSILFLCTIHFSLDAQEATIKGVVSDSKGKAIDFVNVAIIGSTYGVITDGSGVYEITLPSDSTVYLVFSKMGYARIIDTLSLTNGQVLIKNVKLETGVKNLSPVNVFGDMVNEPGIVPINAKIATQVPSITGGIESLVKMQLGVSSSNELSSQYSVRGGNFDENLVYVNDIQIYRPFLIRSGQQEGLSFVNTDLVSQVKFSAGGFDAKYGDKMSSVLDVDYKKPYEFGASATLSLLGTSAHFEGVALDSNSLTYLFGFRYKSNKYVFNAMETKGDYFPTFMDVQTYITYDINKKLEIAFLGNYAINTYQFIPQTRETSYGTITEAYQLTVFFDGQEMDRYESKTGALTASYMPNDSLLLKFIYSAYQSNEQETFDIQGQYWIGKLETDLGKEEFGEVTENLGVGTYINHARNYLDAIVYNFSHKGTFITDKIVLDWGARFQIEDIVDKVSEWEYIDSSGFSMPSVQDSIGYTNPSSQAYQFVNLTDVIKTNYQLKSNRVSAYVQNMWKIISDSTRLHLTTGVRANYWDVNEELLISPRASISYHSGTWKRDITYRFATGIYYQPPFYSEMKDLSGNLNVDIKAQRSIHFVFGQEWNLFIWNRPFKYITEVYYKKLDNLVPYEISNLGIRYYGENMASGDAYGIDMKINGEFVKGIESWAGVSVMRIHENLVDDSYWKYYNSDGDIIIPGYSYNNVAVDSLEVEPGNIARPTDQRVSFSLFFQDYLPQNPTFKMHLNMVFGTGLPFGPKGSERYQQTSRMPAYKRVDIGFSKQFVGDFTTFKKDSPWRHIKNLWLSVEVFNLLNINNVVSYLWVTDVTNRQHAVPNYLTPRQLNIKIHIDI